MMVIKNGVVDYSCKQGPRGAFHHYGERFCCTLTTVSTTLVNQPGCPEATEAHRLIHRAGRKYLRLRHVAVDNPDVAISAGQRWLRGTVVDLRGLATPLAVHFLLENRGRPVWPRRLPTRVASHVGCARSKRAWFHVCGRAVLGSRHQAWGPAVALPR